MQEENVVRRNLNVDDLEKLRQISSFLTPFGPALAGQT